MSDNLENLLAQALVPVEPPVRMRGDLSSRLQAITESAQEELEGWERSAMRDPRNWVRPVAAAIIGTAAGTALIVIEVRAAHRQRVTDGEALPLKDLAGRTARGLGASVRSVSSVRSPGDALDRACRALAGATAKLQLGERFDAARRSMTGR